MEKSQATRLRHASAAPQTDDVSTLMQNKAIHCSRHRYRKKKKNASWPFYFGNNGPLCIFRTRIWLMKSANWPFFFLVVSDFIRFCQNEWIHCESSNVYNVDRAKVYNRQIWGGSLNNSTIVIVFISMDSIHFDDHGHDSLSDRTALGIHFSRKILKKHSNWIEEN